jgi:hypothetical protein
MIVIFSLSLSLALAIALASHRHRRLSCTQNVFICYYFKLYFQEQVEKYITFQYITATATHSHTQNTFSWHLMKMKLACLMDRKKRAFDVALSLTWPVDDECGQIEIQYTSSWPSSKSLSLLIAK